MDHTACELVLDLTVRAQPGLARSARFAAAGAEPASQTGSVFGRVGWVSESEPDDEGVSGAVLAEKLLAVQRLLAALNADSDVRIRLNLRFMAICTSLKTPGANSARGLRRLDRLIADAELARDAAGGEV
jgi:hypothetical protein